MTKFLPLNFFEFVVDKCEFFGYNSKSKRCRVHIKLEQDFIVL